MKIKSYNKRLIYFFYFIYLTFILSCSINIEEKSKKFLGRGKVYYEKGEYRKAIIEFKNSLKVNPKFANGYYYLGLAHYKMQNSKAAYKNFFSAVKLDPDIVDAQLKIGQYFLLIKEYDKAIEKADIVLLKEKDNVISLLLKYSAIGLKGDISGAIKGLKKTLKTNPDSLELYIQLAQFHVRNNDSISAANTINNAFKVDDKNPLLYISAANIYYALGMFKNIEDIFASGIKKMPNEIVLRMHLARYYMSRANKKMVEDTLLKAISVKPDDITVSSVLSGYYVKGRQFAKAESVIKNLIEKAPEKIEIKISLGDFYKNTKQYDKAINVFKSILKTEDQNFVVKGKIGELHFLKGNIEKAMKIIKEIIEDNPGDLTAHMLKGKINLAENNFTDAISEFRQVLKDKPMLFNIRYLLAQAHLLNKEKELAKKEGRRVLKENPSFKPTYNLLFSIYSDEKNLDSLLRELKGISKNNPKNAVVKTSISDIYILKKEYSKALEIYKKLSGKQPGNYEYLIKSGSISRLMKNPDKAINYFNKALEIKSDIFSATFALAKTYLELKQFDEAIKVSTNFLKKNPKDFRALGLLGEINFLLGKFIKSETYFKKAIELNFKWSNGYTSLAKVYETQWAIEKGISEFQTLSERYPSVLEIRYELAKFNQMNGNFDVSEAIYKEIIKKKPDFYYALNNLAYIYAETGKNLDKGIDLINDAIKKAKLSPKKNMPVYILNDTLGWIHYKKGEYNKALSLLKRSNKKSPNNPEILYHLGMVNYKMQNIEDAKDAFKKAIMTKRTFNWVKEVEEILKKI